MVEETSLEELIIPPGWITTREARQRAGLTANGIVKWIHQGKVKARWRGRVFIIEEESLEATLQAQEVPAGWMTISKASKWTGHPPSTIKTWIYKGKLRAKKVGRRWVVEEKSLEN